MPVQAIIVCKEMVLREGDGKADSFAGVVVFECERLSSLSSLPYCSTILFSSVSLIAHHRSTPPAARASPCLLYTHTSLASL